MMRGINSLPDDEVFGKTESTMHMIVDDSDVDEESRLEAKLDKLTKVLTSLVIGQEELALKMETIEKDIVEVRHELLPKKEDMKLPVLKVTRVIRNPYKKPSRSFTDLNGSIFVKDNHGNLFRRFTKGEPNSKGGVYAHDYGARVYLHDEKKFATVEDETQYYCWVKIDGEEYRNKAKGRKKMKQNVRSPTILDKHASH